MGAVVRVVQISDTHLSARAGAPPEWAALVRWLTDDPPDLVVHSGDIVLEDPDDDADRAFAAELMAALPCPWVVIPGNHDVGFYGEEDDLPRRLRAFTRDVGRRPLRPSSSTDGGWSASTPTCSARRSTTPG